MVNAYFDAFEDFRTSTYEICIPVEGARPQRTGTPYSVATVRIGNFLHQVAQSESESHGSINTPVLGNLVQQQYSAVQWG